MSILIKGIDMPKEKDEALLLLILGDGTVAEKIDSDRYEEMTNTQAIQIPKGHGRLIDASELDKCWEEKEDISGDVDFKILYKCVLAISKYAPTILESEEADEHNI